MPEGDKRHIVYLQTSVLCEMNDDGIFVVNQFFGQDDRDYRNEVLAINLGLIEQWRAWASIHVKDYTKDREATELAYKVNAIDRYLFPRTPPVTKPLGEHRVFFPEDIVPMIESTRDRITEELERTRKPQPTITIPFEQITTTPEEKALKDCYNLKHDGIYNPLTINKMLTDKYGAMPAQAAMRQVFPQYHWSN